MTTGITVIGGGVAGLALAATLDPARFDVTLVEQRAELPPTATSLGIWPEARAALERLGVFDTLAARSPGLDRFPLRSAHGDAWADLRVPWAVLVARLDLLHALEAAVPATVRRVLDRVDPEGVESSGDALVVGADGVHSAVRRAGWSRADATLTPYLAVRGVLAQHPADIDVGEYWGRGQLFGVGPHRAGTNWYTAFRSDLGPRHVDVDEALEAARRRAGAVAPALARVLEAATPETTLAQRIWTTPRLRSYVRGRFVLVGDAAHAMTPNLGRGACESLVDAVTLGRLLNTRPIAEALAAYDRERVRPTQRLRAASGMLMRLALLDRTQPVRDRLVAFAGRRSASLATGAPVAGAEAEPVTGGRRLAG
ncbi:FAD-dependent monooxygenase [Agromyces bauzanensis]